MRKKIAVYPGTFDPIHRGHLDGFRAAVDLFDEVVGAVGNNRKKRGKTTFTVEENLALMVECFEQDPVLSVAYAEGRLRVDSYPGLLVRYAQEVGATHIVRGMRSLTDFDYELQLHHANRRLAPDLRTWFVMSDERFQTVSSTMAKEFVENGEDASWMLTPNVEKALRARLTAAA